MDSSSDDHIQLHPDDENLDPDDLEKEALEEELDILTRRLQSRCPKRKSDSKVIEFGGFGDEDLDKNPSDYQKEIDKSSLEPQLSQESERIISASMKHSQSTLQEVNERIEARKRKEQDDSSSNTSVVEDPRFDNKGGRKKRRSDIYPFLSSPIELSSTPKTPQVFETSPQPAVHSDQISSHRSVRSLPPILMEPVVVGNTYTISEETLEKLEKPDGHVDPSIQHELKRWIQDDWEMLTSAPRYLHIGHFVRALPFRMSNTVILEKISRAYTHLRALNIHWQAHTSTKLTLDQLDFISTSSTGYQSVHIATKLVNQMSESITVLKTGLDSLRDSAQIIVAESKRNCDAIKALYEQVFLSMSTKVNQLTTVMNKAGAGTDDKTGQLMLGKTTPSISRAPSISSLPLSSPSTSGVSTPNPAASPKLPRMKTLPNIKF